MNIHIPWRSKCYARSMAHNRQFGLAAAILLAGITGCNPPVSPSSKISTAAVDNPAVFTDRVIPLPKEVSISKQAKISANCIVIEPWNETDPIQEPALAILRRFALGTNAAGAVTIKLLAGQSLPEPIRSQLAGLKNGDQAYAIRSSIGDGRITINVFAIHPCGLYYAAQTLYQMIAPPSNLSPKDQVVIPVANVTDWPDMPQRGWWNAMSNLGGIEGTRAAIDNAARWKLNRVELHSRMRLDPADETMCLELPRDIIEYGRRAGVRVVPIVCGHLQHTVLPGNPHVGWLYQKGQLKKWRDVLRVPNPNDPQDKAVDQGLCLTNPKTLDYFSEWTELCAALIEGCHDELTIWLSEGHGKFLPCYCPACAGKEPFLLETELVLNVLKRVKIKYPWLKLSLGLTQGTRDAGVNERIAAMLPPDVALDQYDGISRFGGTYVTDHDPMITPWLEGVAKSGRHVFIVPQITQSWRTLFPMTSPQFVRFRAREFVSNGLYGVVAWIMPNADYHAPNTAAMAEWTWNANSRSVGEFARAYAAATGLCPPERYAEWVELIGPAGWDFAEARVMIRACDNPALGFDGKMPYHAYFYNPKEKRGITELTNSSVLAAELARVEAALVLARGMNEPSMIAESEALLAALRGFGLLLDISRRLDAVQAGAPSAEDRAQLPVMLASLDIQADAMERAVRAWGDALKGPGYKHMSRFEDTAMGLRKISEQARKAVGNKIR